MNTKDTKELFIFFLCIGAFFSLVYGLGQLIDYTESIRLNKLTPRQRALEHWGCERSFEPYSRSPRQVYECNKLFRMEESV